MKKNIMFIISAIFIILAVCVVSVRLISDNKADAVLYYISEDGYGLEPVEKRIVYSNEKQIPADVAELLKKKPRNLENPVGEKAVVNSIVYEGEGKMTIDFNDEFLTADVSKNTLKTYAFIKSVYSVVKKAGIEKIRITVDSLPVITSGGNEIGYISGDEIIDARNIVNKKSDYILYFRDKETGGFRGEKREFITKSGSSVEKKIIEALIDGPVSSELERVLTPDTEVKSVEILDGLCFVNFSVINRKSNSDEAISSVAQTLFSEPQISKVIIMDNGVTVKEFHKEDA